jgi:hypothetical protein
MLSSVERVEFFLNQLLIFFNVRINSKVAVSTFWVLSDHPDGKIFFLPVHNLALNDRVRIILAARNIVIKLYI